jgi:glycosyltransferase involved in cell wall biosynthesis
MSNLRPLVSVYLPTRNRINLLRRAVSSVFAQTLSNFELIIVDDCSDDETAEYCASLQTSDTRVRCYRTYARSGAPYARNLAISHARSDLVTGLDDDDEMLPSRLASLLASFDARYSLVSSPAYIRTESWQRISNAGAKVITLDDLFYDNIVGTQMLTLKSRMTSIGGFDESLTSAQDYDMWVRLVEKFGPASRTATPTYVMHADNRPDRISIANAPLVGGFLAKHRSLMNPLQIATQELYVVASKGDPLHFARWVELTNRKTWVKSTRYLITSRVPQLRRVGNALRSFLSRSQPPR